MKIISLICIFTIALFGCKKSMIEEPISETNKEITPILKNTSIIYYVSPDGNDNNSGLADAPFKTIQKAADLVNPGDTVIIKDGVYLSSSETMVNINKGGTADRYITFKAEHSGELFWMEETFHLTGSILVLVFRT
jgi:hypothetical protein